MIKLFVVLFIEIKGFSHFSDNTLGKLKENAVFVLRAFLAIYKTVFF